MQCHVVSSIWQCLLRRLETRFLARWFRFRKEHPKTIENQCCWSIVGEFQFGGFATTMVLPIATTIALEEEILVLEMAMLRSVTSSSSRVSPTRYHRSSSPETMETLLEIPSKNPGKNPRNANDLTSSVRGKIVQWYFSLMWFVSNQSYRRTVGELETGCFLRASTSEKVGKLEAPRVAKSTLKHLKA